jgi:hypothetical protein
MRRSLSFAIRTSAVVTALTVIVGIASLLGIRDIPILGLVLWPGGVIAWAWHGDNYRDSTHFLSYAVPISVAVNLAASFLAGAAIGFISHSVRSSQPPAV